MEAKECIVKVENIKKFFGDNRVLDGISFQIPKGEHFAILGPGGCGKSTLLKIIVGLIEPDDGRIEMMGQTLANLRGDQRRELLSKVGVAFQGGALFDFMTVKENVLFAMENMTSLPDSEMQHRALSMLNAVNLPHAIEKLPSELSGGMRRRVGVVRALATHPVVAVLDEPTAGLDPVTSTVVIQMIHKLAAETHSTLVCMTSNVDVAFRFAKRVGVTKDGKIVAIGTFKELAAHKDPWLNAFLTVRGTPTHESTFEQPA